METIFNIYARFMAYITTGINSSELLNWNEFDTYMSAYQYYHHLAPQVLTICCIIMIVFILASVAVIINHKKNNA